MNLEEMRAERARLDEEISKAEANERADWNSALWACEDALTNWLQAHEVEYSSRDRKNETIWDIGHGALVVTFATDEENYARGLRMWSGETLRLDWSQVPEPARMLAVAAVLLGKP